MTQQLRANADTVVTLLSNEIATLSREKAIAQAQLHEMQQLCQQLQQQLDDMKQKDSRESKQAQKK